MLATSSVGTPLRRHLGDRHGESAYASEGRAGCHGTGAPFLLPDQGCRPLRGAIPPVTRGKTVCRARPHRRYVVGMTTHATYADGPRDIEPPQLPRLVGHPRGQGLADGQPRPTGHDRGDRPHLPDALPRGHQLMDLLGPVAHNITSLVTAPLGLVLMTLGIAGFVSLPAVLVGVLLLVPALWGSWGLSRLERHRIAAMLGVDIGERPPSTAPGWRRGLGLDENRLRALGWSSLHGLWGLVAGCLTVVVLAQGLLLGTLPLWGWGLDGVNVLWMHVSRTLGG